MKYVITENHLNLMETKCRSISLDLLTHKHEKELTKVQEKLIQLRDLVDHIRCCPDISIRMNAGYECNHEFANEAITKMKQAELDEKVKSSQLADIKTKEMVKNEQDNENKNKLKTNK